MAQQCRRLAQVLGGGMPHAPSPGCSQQPGMAGLLIRPAEEQDSQVGPGALEAPEQFLVMLEGPAPEREVLGAAGTDVQAQKPPSKSQGESVIETPTWNRPIEPYRNPFVLVKKPVVDGPATSKYYRYDSSGIQRHPSGRWYMASVPVEEVYRAVEAALQRRK